MHSVRPPASLLRPAMGLCSLLAVLAIGSASFGQSAALRNDASALRLVALDMELTGDLGGAELSSEHQARLDMATERLRDALDRTAAYEVVDPAPAMELIERLKSQHRHLHDCNGCDLDVGRRLAADQVLVAWVHRVSLLILTLSYEIHDVRTGKIVARKSFDFRGDTDAAWQRAIAYMVRDLEEEMARERKMDERPSRAE